MKGTFFVIIFLIAFIESARGQNCDSCYNRLQIDFDAIYTPILSRNFIGIGFEAKYSPIRRLETGLYSAFTQMKISNSFNYNVGQPIIWYYEVGWINQYDFIQTGNVCIGLNCVNGISISRLGDNSDKIPIGKFGYRPKEIATNYYYLFEPGLDVSIKMLSDKSNNNYGVWLIGKVKYRLVFGNSKYASTINYDNYLMALGVSFRF